MNLDPSLDSGHAGKDPASFSKNKYVLLTGATGFVGQYLLRDLIESGHSVAVIARASKQFSAAERVEQIMQRWEAETGKHLPRPIVLQGNITEKHLGLPEQDVDWIKRQVDLVIHNAAILKFQGEPGNEPWNTNLGGTQNIVQLARDCQIKKFHYVSTAYTCGIRTTTVEEDLFDVGQQFRNDYERSKFAAEKYVREANFESLTVYRPAVIVGDSENGFTSSYHGLYVYLRLMAMLIPQQQRDANGIAQTPIRLPMNGDERRNLVPVNWVSQVITRIVNNPAAWGRTFHLTPTKLLTPRELIDHCYGYFNSSGVEYCGPTQKLEQPSEFGSNFLQNIELYQPYDSSDPIFDTTNLNQFVGDIPCPEIDQETVFKFIQFC